MQIALVSYNGVTLDGSSDYSGWIVKETPMQPIVNPIYTRRAGAFPVYAGKDFLDQTLNIGVRCNGSFNSQLETLIKYFDVQDETPRQLIVKDTEDSNRQWAVYATTRQMGQQDGTTVYITLSLDNPIWEAVTEVSTAWTINSTDDDQTVTAPAGNMQSYPRFELTPTAYPSTGYIYNRFVLYVPPTTDTWNNVPLDVTGGGLDTAAIVAGGKALATGDDFRVFVDGVEVDRWFGGAGFNTTDTKVFININEPHKRTFLLKTAIGATDTVTEVEAIYSSANKVNFDLTPVKSRFLINNEEFTYTGKTSTSTKLAFTGVTRSTRNTSAAAHSASDTISWIPYDINVIYGSTDAEAPAVDDAKKPIINLTNSNNGSFDYDEFVDEDRLRSAIWKPVIVSRTSPTLSQSDIYTGTQNGGDTDPATVMGAFVVPFQSAGVWKAETSKFTWTNYFPRLVSTVAFTYEQYQATSAYPTTAALQTSKDGVTFGTIKNRASSDVASTDYGTWVTGTYATTDTTVAAGVKYLRQYFYGTIPAISTAAGYLGYTDVTVNFTTTPTVTMRAEQNNYQFNATITNENTGEFFTVNYPLKTGETMYIDCDPDFPTAKLNGQIVNGAISTNTVRAAWLTLVPDVDNTINHSSTLVGTIDAVIKYNARMSYL